MISFLTRKSKEDSNYHHKCKHFFMFLLLFSFRKIPPNVVGRPRRIARRSPPQHVSRDERERLVDMATKLIVATVKKRHHIS